MTRSRILAIGACFVLAGPLSLVACGGDSGGNGGTDPVVVDEVSVTPGSPSIQVGQTVQLAATPLDADGDPLSRAVTWTSLNGGVASVSSSGLVTGLSQGSAEIRATSEGVNGSVTVTVTPRPVARVAVTPDSSDLAVGGQLQLTATTHAANDSVLTGRAIAWSTSNAAVATVSAGGLVTANDAGVAIISAMSEGIVGTAKVVVTVASLVVIDSITPAVVTEGGTATIYGTGFDATIAGNVVTVDSVAATITAATETMLQVTLPAPAGCRPARNAAFRATAGGNESAAFPHAVRPESFLDMAVGEQAILSSPAALCLQFAQESGAQRYVIGVQSTSSSGASLTPARLSAIAGAGPAAAPPVTFQPQLSASRAAGVAGVAPSAARIARLAEHREAELGLRERERALVDQLVAARAARRSAPSLSNSMAAVAATAAVGDTVTMRVVDPSATNLCSTFSTVTAVVRVIGTSGIWLTDITNPAGGYSDADLQMLSDVFDNEIYATDVDYLGPPTDIDANGRIAILTTRRVNATPGLLGFVFSGDLFPTGSCAASNVGEVYYGIAPDPTGLFGGAYSLADARLDAPALIAHEFAHILQNANGNHSREVWESEGQATLMEEVVGFATQGRGPGNNYGFEIATNLSGGDSISWYFGHMFGLMTYYGYPNANPGAQIAGAPEQCTWLVRPPNGPCLNAGRLVYDVPKSLLRYISDQFGPSHAQGEKGVQRDLLESTASGFDAIEAVTGLPIETVLARWSASLYVDGRFPNMSPTLQTTTWDLFAIWQGLITNTHLTPRPRGFATFSDDFSVRGGSTAYFTVSGAARPPVAISVGSQSGAALPSFVQVWVVRAE